MKYIALALLLAACQAAPAPTYTAPVELPLSVQSTLIVAQATQIAGDVARATEARRATEQAIADAQTATAYPLALVATQSAMTATALPMQVTAAAIVDGATLGAVQTQQANIRETSTAYAGIYVSMTATAEAVEDYRADRASEWLGRVGGGILALSLAIVGAIIMLVGGWTVVLFGVHLDRRVNAPREFGGRLMIPTRAGWRVVEMPQLQAPQAEAMPDAKPLPPYALQWQSFWVRVCERSGELGGLAYRRQFERVLPLEDWQTGVRDSMVHFGIAQVVPYNSGDGVAWAEGWDAQAAAQFFRDNVPDWTPSPTQPPLFVKQTAPANSVKQAVGAV